MAKVHGKQTVFKLDDLAGVLQDISAKLDSVTFTPGSDRPETQTFGQAARRREVLGLRRASFSVAGFYTEAATKIHGKNTRVCLDEFVIGSKLNQATVSRSVDQPLTHTFGDGFEEHDVPGLLDGSLSFTGPYDGAANEIDSILKTRLGQEAVSVCSLAPNGFTVGNLVEMAALVPQEQPINSSESDLTTTSCTAPTDGPVDLGVALHDNTAETGIVNGTTVDETAATANGGVGHLHVTAFGATSVTVKIQHSTDNSVWNDLITFVAATAVGKQRIELAGGTTVNRYVRYIISAMTGASITFVVAFARRSFAYGTAGTHRHFAGLYGQGMGASPISSTFQYGPEGGTSGKQRRTGECVLTSYEVTYSENDVTKFSAELVATGTVTEDTF